MKVDRNGKAAVVTAEQLEQLLAAAPSPRYRLLWALQRWTAARISEALALRWADVNGMVQFRAATTKMKSTRAVPTCPALQRELQRYRVSWIEEHGHEPARDEVLFPSPGSTTSPMSRQAADKVLRQTCSKLGLVGISTHSFRRTLAQDAVDRGVPLHVVQRTTGHKSLSSLGEYLSATDDQVLAAIGGE